MNFEDEYWTWKIENEESRLFTNIEWEGINESQFGLEFDMVTLTDGETLTDRNI